MEERAGGNGPISELRSRENVIRRALLFRDVEALRLQIEHGPVAAAERHELIVRAELDDAAVLEDADAIGMADGGEAMRDEDGGAMAGGGEEAVEDLGFAAHVELGGGLIEQHDARSELNGGQGAGERNALPLAAGEVRAAIVAAGENGVERGEIGGSSGF